MGLDDKPRVAVLYGGNSNERDVSLRSGLAVGRALLQIGYPVLMLDTRYVPPAQFDAGTLDACFIALHGAFGEDGGIQSVLDDMAIPYTGCGARASRLAMDKRLAKQHFGAAGVRTPSYESIDREWPLDRQVAAARSLGFPLIVKPAADGSSVGVSKVDDAAQLPAALTAATASDRFAMAEPFIGGPELTVGVLDDCPLPLIQILYTGPVWTKEDKYTPGASQHVLNPPLPPDVVREVIDLALGAHHALGCEGCTRVDLRLDEVLCPWVLEVNTIPGMTETSLIPDAARAAGIPFPRLCERLVEIALRDRSKRQPVSHSALVHSVGV
jgi:D-alanine-D-alanine ligase